MAKTITFGAFVNDTGAGRLAEAQAAARALGVEVSADGSAFAGRGRPGDPLKVTVTVPRGVALNAAIVAQGRAAFDRLLRGNERLTDYAVIKDDGVVTGAVSLLTGEVQTAPAAPAAPVQAAAPGRWTPFTA